MRRRFAPALGLVAVLILACAGAPADAGTQEWLDPTPAPAAVAAQGFGGDVGFGGDLNTAAQEIDRFW